MIVKAVALKSYKLIKGVEFLPEALSVYKKDPMSFFETYGDTFVMGIRPGGIFYGAIFIDCYDENQKKDITTELYAKLDLLKASLLKVEAEASFKKYFMEARKNSEFSVHVFGEGPPHDFQTNDLDEMVKFASYFSTKIHGHEENEWYIKALLWDYQSVRLPDGGLPDRGSSLNSLIEKRGQLFAKCAELNSQKLY